VAPVNRRDFLTTTAALAAATAVPSGLRAVGKSPKKAVLISMLPEKLSYRDRFQLAKEAGYEGIEMMTVKDPKEAEEIRGASQSTGLKIHSVMNMDHWKYPLSSNSPEDVLKSVKGMETSLRNAKLWGADVVLLVPAVVNQHVGYKTAYDRSQKVIREKILPLAAELKVIVGIEEVWNKFLLSPLEMGRYIDEFQSPWVKAYFDVGNVLLFGYPQDWIRTLGKRIVKIHLKDFSMDRSEERFHWKNLGEGDIDWPEVRKALSEIGYEGYVTVEIEGGDLQYLKDVSNRVGRFLAGEAKLKV
jgi:L-ribulose-5-phosphate 3-epimerase